MYQEPSPKMLPSWVSPSLSGVFLGFFVFSFPAPAFDSHQHPRSRSNSKRGAEEAASCGPQLLALAEGGVCSLLASYNLRASALLGREVRSLHGAVQDGSIPPGAHRASAGAWCLVPSAWCPSGRARYTCTSLLLACSHPHPVLTCELWCQAKLHLVQS